MNSQHAILHRFALELVGRGVKSTAKPHKIARYELGCLRDRGWLTKTHGRWTFTADGIAELERYLQR